MREVWPVGQDVLGDDGVSGGGGGGEGGGGGGGGGEQLRREGKPEHQR